ncbi:MAG: hypothetical protein PVSMB5_29600 [Ktedonobacteraceae bacterium]
MNSVTLRRIGIIGLILTVLVGIDGAFMLATNYKPDDASSNTLHMTDGTTVLIAAALLLIISVIAFMLASQTRKTEAAVGTMGTLGGTPSTTTAESQEAAVGEGVRPEETKTEARPEMQG